MKNDIFSSQTPNVPSFKIKSFFLTTNLCLYLFDLIFHVLVSVIYLLHNQIFLMEMNKRLKKTKTKEKFSSSLTLNINLIFYNIDVRKYSKNGCFEMSVGGRARELLVKTGCSSIRVRMVWKTRGVTGLGAC